MSRTYRDRGYYNSYAYQKRLDFSECPKWSYKADSCRFKRDSKYYKKLMNKTYRMLIRSKYLNRHFDDTLFPNSKTCVNIGWWDA